MVIKLKARADSILGGTLTPTQFYPCHSSESGGEAEEPDTEGGPEGKNKKPGLLDGGSSPLEQSASAPSLGTFKSQLKTWMFRQASPPS